MTDFVEIIQLKLLHSFYVGGSTADFDIKPLAATQQALANLRLLVRQDGGILRLFAEAKDGKPLVDLADLTSLSFGLSLRNRAFLTFTDLPEHKPAHRATYDAGQQADRLWLGRLPSYAFANAVGQSTLASQAIYNFFGSVPVVIKTAQPHTHVTVDLKRPDGTSARQKSYLALPGATDDTKNNGWITDALPVEDLPPGLYTLSSDIAGQDDIPILLQDELQYRHFRTVWITLAPGALLDGDGKLKPTTSFTAQFSPVEKVWRYHVNVGAKRKDKDFKISHTPTGADTQITFGDPAEDTTGGKRLLTFQSTAPVSFREKPRKAIQLIEKADQGAPAQPPGNGGGGGGGGGGSPPAQDKTIIGNLPSPSPADVNAEVYVQV
ncbi:hypothetical protein [Kordiimonas lacus]|uniref:Uncharacterized protein n=1 Tax=Kordiimonas lacus TaxID=637679 RepID=A0A1G7A4H8_9PROT|nr:hypothetical protein [Kordiimonas lacus]SDE09680.1 hypothetical protein SAMN04488071_2083 [Kordiimonas lacus]